MGLWWVPSPICLCTDTTGTLSACLPGAPLHPAACACTTLFCSITATCSAKTFGSRAFPANKQVHSLALFAASLYPNQNYKVIFRLFLRSSLCSVWRRLLAARVSEMAHCSKAMSPPSHILMCTVRECAQLFSLIKNNL